jgi:hypothetical protein
LNDAWPEFPAEQWRDTYETLHMWSQIVGKTRLALAPMENHWWQVTLYLTPCGFTTSPIPAGDRSLAIDFDFIAHRLIIRSSDGVEWSMALTAMSVADFYAQYMDGLLRFNLRPRLFATPVEVQVAIPFAQDHEHKHYEAHAAHAVWRIFLCTDRVLKRFRSAFLGKQSPVHFFWGSFDLAATRFSGRSAPPHPGGVPNCPDRVMVEAYSHECSSCGFWPGDGAANAAAFYAYAYPAPRGFEDCVIEPTAARYDRQAREFLLPYDALRAAENPDAALLRFFETAYSAAAGLGRWDRSALERERLSTGVAT